MANFRPPPARPALPPLKGRSAIVDVISALNQHDGKFPAREQRVADYVMAHLDEISSMTIGNLAARCDVSKPTVIRFCRTLGCDGFRDFKLRLAQNLAVSMQYLSPQPKELMPGGDLGLDRIMNAILAAAESMRQQVDLSALNAARTALIGARNLLCAGIGGGSSMVAHEAENRFFRLGIPSFATSDSYILQMRAATLREDDVLLLVSASGEADALVGAADVASGYGATTISITRSGSRLANISDIPITVDLPEDIDIYKPSALRIVHLILIDTLSTAVAHEKSGEAGETLRRVRASLTAYHGRTGPQPLGD